MPVLRSRLHHTLADYRAAEELSPLRHELADGVVIAMAGASPEHHRIARDVLVALDEALRGGPCEAFGSDQRIRTPDGLYTYPDASVVCGPLVLDEDVPATVCNPTVLVEVLSPSTREYDLGEKRARYLEIPTLTDLLILEVERASVVHLRRDGDGWLEEHHVGVGGRVALSCVPGGLPLAAAYRSLVARP